MGSRDMSTLRTNRSKPFLVGTFNRGSSGGKCFSKNSSRRMRSNRWLMIGNPPTVQERSADIPILIDHFIKLFAKKHGKQIKGVSSPARRKLLAFDWPGNVRQLRNVVESMVVVDYDGLLDTDDLPEELSERGEPAEHSAITSLAGLVGKPLQEIGEVLGNEIPQDGKYRKKGKNEKGVKKGNHPSLSVPLSFRIKPPFDRL